MGKFIRIREFLGPRELGYKRREALEASTEFGRGPKFPRGDVYPQAVAMILAALNQNDVEVAAALPVEAGDRRKYLSAVEDIRSLWREIRISWALPGCTSFEYFTQSKAELRSWVAKILDGERGAFLSPPVDTLKRAFREWQKRFSSDPDVVHLNSLVNDFILKSFNGPIGPTRKRKMGPAEHSWVPRLKILVTHKTAHPVLKHTILWLSWCDYKDINLQELDRERIGEDYELVTSGAKPTTLQARKRKVVINKQVKEAGLHFLSDKPIRKWASTWYHARVIKGNVTEVASDLALNSASILENKIKPYDQIAGLRLGR